MAATISKKGALDLAATMPTLAALRGRLGALAGGLGGRAAPIGLDIASEQLHLVQFDTGGAQPTIRAAVSLPYAGGREALLADPGRLRTLVRQALAARPFRGRRVVSCLSAADMQIMLVGYQKAAGQDDATAIVRELRERLKGELASLVVDYVPIRADDSSTERSAIVFAAPRERVIAYLEALRSAGLETVALDVGPAALTRLVASLDRSGAHLNTLLLNFGRTRSYLSVIWGRRLMLDRDIEFGEHRLVQRLDRVLGLAEPEALRLLRERGLGVDPGLPAASMRGAASVAQTIAEVLRPEFDRLAEEINRTLIYTASKTRGESIQRVYLLGSVARYPGIAALIEKLVAVPVEVIDPLRAFASVPGATAVGADAPGAGIGLAAGLALRPTRSSHG